MHEIQPRLVGTSSILVGATELTPAASHLFALLLVLILSPRDAWTRRGLQELLFPELDDRMASHRLRQLLYRLRTFGVAMEESPGGELRILNPIADPLPSDDEGFTPPSDGAAAPPPRALGHYTPRLPAPFLDWLEQRRDALQHTLSARRMARLRLTRERQDWPACSRLAATLRHDEPFSEELATIAAESFAMLGRRDEAVEVIDQFVRDSERSADDYPQLRKLRARILSTRIGRREGTLRGREECLAFLAEQWEQATRIPGGRAAAVVGPPGMGKTRVGETFAATARLAGGQLLQYRCDGQARQTPLALFAHLVPELRKRRGSIGANPALSGVLDRIAPDVAAPAPEQVRPEERRGEVKRAVLDLIGAVTSEQPMLVLVDDAHLLDDASRAVIHAIVDSSNDAHVLFLLLCRPRPDGHSLLSAAPRFSTYTLTPLSDADSRALLLELARERQPGEEELSWAVSQAGGNAFYLHALAHQPLGASSLPAHIRSLATSSYLGISPDARTVLDTCLLLDTLASPARVAHVSDLGGQPLLAALRELEEADLLRYDDGVFVRPHAILCEALDELMPSGTRAALHHRIATLLSRECANPAQARVVAWPAVSSWLAAGEPTAAVELALQVARRAEEVGEPEAGALLLGQIPREALSTPAQREVLDEIIRLAEAGKCLLLLGQTLRDRIALANQTMEDATTVADLTIRSMTAHLIAGQRYDLGEIKSILLDPHITPVLRVEAITRILGDADLEFDSERAGDAFELLLEVTPRRLHESPAFLRASLIYQTTFGCTHTAHHIIDKLFDQFPEPALDLESRRARFYIVFGLLRLGLYREAAIIARDSWQYMHQQHHLLSAVDFGSLAAEGFISAGDYQSARELLADVQRAVQQRRLSEDTLPTPFCAPAIALAMEAGQLEEAQRLLDKAKREYPFFDRPRHRSLSLALQIRISQLSGLAVDREHLSELATLFARGCRFTQQDTSAEALWHAYIADGDKTRASQMLRDYLSVRREPGSPDAGLRSSTATDPVWLEYEATITHTAS